MQGANRIWLSIVGTALLLVTLACGASSNAVQQAQTVVAQVTPSEVLQEASTALAPTTLPGPTDTPESTPTPQQASPSPTSPPSPIVLKGSGDDVVNLNKWPGLAILHIVGPSSYANFAVWTVDEAGNQTDLLVNTIGAFEGYKLIDLNEGENTYQLQVSATGKWTVEILPLSAKYMHILQLPGQYNGNGPDVVFLSGNPDLATFSYAGNGNFAVWSDGQSGRDLLVNEIGTYSGTVLVPPDAAILEIDADVKWSASVTAK